MIKNIIKQIRYIKSIIREKRKLKTRSPHWDSVRKTFIQAHPSCEACGSLKKLQVHHILPFHLCPELELDTSNLITLCMDNNECHLEIGHGGSFKSFNPYVRPFAQRFLIETDILKRKLLIETCSTIRKNVVLVK